MNLRPVIMAILAAVSPACAAISSLGTASVDREAAVSYNQWLATSIVGRETAAPMLVQSLTLRLDCVAPNRSVFVAITGSVNQRPALDDIRVIIDTAPLTPGVHLSSVIMVTLEPLAENAPPLLTPGEEYWIVFGVTGPDWEEDNPAGLYRWSYAAAGGPFDAEPDWSIGSRVATGNTGGQNWTTENATPYSFSLTLAAVPEPRGILLAAAGLPLWFRRRRTRP